MVNVIFTSLEKCKAILIFSILPSTAFLRYPDDLFASLTNDCQECSWTIKKAYEDEHATETF